MFGRVLDLSGWNRSWLAVVLNPWLRAFRDAHTYALHDDCVVFVLSIFAVQVCYDTCSWCRWLSQRR